MASYLIQYHRRSGELDIHEFDSLSEATLRRLELDEANDDPDLEVVAVASEEHLRQSHSRYFSKA